MYRILDIVNGQYLMDWVKCTALDTTANIVGFEHVFLEFKTIEQAEEYIITEIIDNPWSSTWQNPCIKQFEIIEILEA